MKNKLKESISKKDAQAIKQWWKDVDKLGKLNIVDIDTIDTDDIEDWHGAMFDALCQLSKDKENKGLVNKGKNLYNKYAISQFNENLNEALYKTTLDYIEDALKEEGIEYEVEQAIDDEPYDTWIIIEGDDGRADDIICSIVGEAYERVKDKEGNTQYFKVATDQETIDKLNESLNESSGNKYKVKVTNIEFDLTDDDIAYMYNIDDEDPAYERKVKEAREEELSKVPSELEYTFDENVDESDIEYEVEDKIEKDLGLYPHNFKVEIISRPNAPEGFKRFDGYATEVGEVGRELITKDGEHIWVTDYTEDDGGFWASRNKSDIEKGLGRYWDADSIMYVSYDINESLNEGWTHFQFKSGSNPYIAKTEKEKARILKKYKGKVEEIEPGFYLINDLNEGLKEDDFNDKMDFLAKDEDEAIDGYKKVIKDIDNKNVKTQLKKIETEEKAHKDYLGKVKKDKNTKYTEPLEEDYNSKTIHKPENKDEMYSFDFWRKALNKAFPIPNQEEGSKGMWCIYGSLVPLFRGSSIEIDHLGAFEEYEQALEVLRSYQSSWTEPLKEDIKENENVVGVALRQDRTTKEIVSQMIRYEYLPKSKISYSRREELEEDKSNEGIGTFDFAKIFDIKDCLGVIICNKENKDQCIVHPSNYLGNVDLEPDTYYIDVVKKIPSKTHKGKYIYVANEDPDYLDDNDFISYSDALNYFEESLKEASSNDKEIYDIDCDVQRFGNWVRVELSNGEELYAPDTRVYYNYNEGIPFEGAVRQVLAQKYGYKVPYKNLLSDEEVQRAKIDLVRYFSQGAIVDELAKRLNLSDKERKDLGNNVVYSGMASDAAYNKWVKRIIDTTNDKQLAKEFLVASGYYDKVGHEYLDGHPYLKEDINSNFPKEVVQDVKDYINSLGFLEFDKERRDGDTISLYYDFTDEMLDKYDELDGVCFEVDINIYDDDVNEVRVQLLAQEADSFTYDICDGITIPLKEYSKEKLNQKLKELINDDLYKCELGESYKSLEEDTTIKVNTKKPKVVIDKEDKSKVGEPGNPVQVGLKGKTSKLEKLDDNKEVEILPDDEGERNMKENNLVSYKGKKNLKEGYIGQTLQDFLDTCVDTDVIDNVVLWGDSDEPIYDGNGYDIPEEYLDCHFIEFDTGMDACVINVNSEEEYGYDTYYEFAGDFIDDCNSDEIEIFDLDTSETLFSGYKEDCPDELRDMAFASFDSPKYLSCNIEVDEEDFEEEDFDENYCEDLLNRII